jgi:glycosyltransferase involved in cell wall biosynthesis
MRICLLSSSYPPGDTEGISRQRQTLATEFARLGHDVHVVTLGALSHVREENGVTVHRVAFHWLNSFSDHYPGLDNTLTRSQTLYEGLYRSLDTSGFDIVDSPLWGAQGVVTQQFYAGCTILWLQTTLAQILKIHERNPGEEEKIKLTLEKMILERADGLLADSQSVVDSIRSDYGISTDAPIGVAYLGLPPLSAQPDRPWKNEVEALVVGRLEKRKGAPLLFEILPALLQQHPQLTVRFVGRDNSVSDGWQALHKTTYPEYFKQRYPQLAARALFEGYVSEERLQEYYNRADIFLAPSLYESFGLTYLEAMRSGLPVITFSTGAATEIFAAGEADGALLVPAENGNEFGAALKKLVEDSRLRNELGKAGLNRFQAAFTVQAMARATLQFYQQALDHFPKARRDTPKIYQAMDALDSGDAVSKITIDHASLLADLGQPKEILTRYAVESVRGYTMPRSRLLSDPDCGLIFHYWGYNPSTWMLSIAKGRKALYYHNITPPHYFSTDSVAYRQTSQGYAQLGRILDHFDLLIGDSQYNIQSLAQYLTRPVPALHIYPVIDPEKLKALPYDKALHDHLRASRQVNILFVGRIARNKRQDRLMQVFDYYCREIDPRAHLWLVGNENGDPAYRAELENLRLSLASCDNVHFTGKISDAEIYAYYRAADIFLSASEHEGFGVPLAEAMAFDVPVIAYAATAVPETMEEVGILVHDWELPRITELLHRTMSNTTLRQTLVRGQHQNLLRFSASEARMRLKVALRFIQRDEFNSLLQLQTPVSQP